MAVGQRKEVTSFFTADRRGLARWVPWLAVGGGLALRQVLLVRSFHTFIDDAYIFMRYGQHAATGHGLVFNTGEHVLGFTSPAYVLLLTLIGTITGVGTLAGAVNIADLVCFVLASAVLIRLSRRYEASMVVLLVAWLAWFPLVAAGVNGMETMLFILLMFGGLASAIEGRYGLAAFVTALTLLARPEGALFAVALAVAVIHHDRPSRRSWPGFAAAIAVLASWAAYAFVTYGTVIPQSLTAKGAVTGSSGGLFQKLAVLATGLSSAQYLSFGPALRILLLALGLGALAVAVGGLLVDIRHHAVAAAIPMWFVFTWLFYVIGHPITLSSWYTAPTTLAIWWTVARHGPNAVDVVMRHLSRPPGSPGRWLVAWLTVVVSFASLGFGETKRASNLNAATSGLASLAGRIQHEAPGRQTVMLGDIGIVGWVTGDKIVDEAGLITPLASSRSHGQFLSIATLAQLTGTDVIALKASPISGDNLDGTLYQRRIYDNRQQQQQLLASYRVVPLGTLSGYRYLLIRRDR